MTHSTAANTSHDADVVTEFKHHVNMTRNELTRWLRTEESLMVGQKKTGGESTGHRSGRRIVQLLEKKKGDLEPADLQHMRKVVGYIKRHMAQRPDQSADEIDHSAWRYSLMNWGHDPLKR
ncbi:DUF3140 domain-containing protein [Paraburkholderia sp. PREW-6R]|uniref:DUF3140 domain-containing protein n=1 Tax=Paraburkholderia sp. PREW-6R TaxID=3141544 RepID=UPI0031F4FD02